MAHSAYRGLSGEAAEAFEAALSDVILFGDDDQIRLARQIGAALVEGGEAQLDALLVSFRSALRRELDLRHDGLQKVPIVRFREAGDRHTPLKVQESWEVATNETRAAVASVTSIPPAITRGTAPESYVGGLISQVEGLRELARAAPGAGVVTSYGHVVAALRALAQAPDDDDRDAPELAREAEGRGLVKPQLVQTIDGLAVLKDLSRDGGSGMGLTADKAADFVDLVAAALYVIYSAGPNDRQAAP